MTATTNLYEFDADTGLATVGGGQYSGRLTDRWNHPMGPDGGYIMAIATRALSQSLPFPDPVTLTAHFLARPEVGDLTVETETIRKGKRHATGTARLIQQDKEIVRVLGTYGDLASAGGRTLVTATPPDLPPPQDCVDPRPSVTQLMSPIPIVDRLDARLPELPGWLRGEPSGNPVSSFWIRFADGRPPDALSMVLLADGAPPAVFELGEFGTVTLELTVHLCARPSEGSSGGVAAPRAEQLHTLEAAIPPRSEGWIACRKETRFLIDGYFEEDCEMWDSAGHLVAQSRQLAMLR